MLILLQIWLTMDWKHERKWTFPSLSYEQTILCPREEESNWGIIQCPLPLFSNWLEDMNTEIYSCTLYSIGISIYKMSSVTINYILEMYFYHLTLTIFIFVHSCTDAWRKWKRRLHPDVGLTIRSLCKTLESSQRRNINPNKEWKEETEKGISLNRILSLLSLTHSPFEVRKSQFCCFLSSSLVAEKKKTVLLFH